MRRPLLYLLPALLLVELASCNRTQMPPPKTDEARWVEKIMLGAEYGGDGAVCARWVTSPTISVFGATAEQNRVVEETVAHLNQTLAQTPIQRMQLLGPNDASAVIQVYFDRLDQFPALASQHGFSYQPGNWGYVWIFWNGKHEIYKARVLLASDKLQGNQLRHFALEELTQSLGLMNDSPTYRDSIFFEQGDDIGDALVLSERDQKLIVFFYNHIQPGDQANQVRRALKQHWK